MDCIIHSFNIRQAEAFGYKITPVQGIIAQRSDPLVHTEIQFSKRYGGKSFSATLMGGEDGCRFKLIRYTHPERWTGLVVPMTNDEEERGWCRAKNLEGCKYDLIGLASFATSLDWIKPHSNKYWCNEAVGEVIKAAMGWTDDYFKPDYYHPNGFFFEMYRIFSEK